MNIRFFFLNNDLANLQKCNQLIDFKPLKNLFYEKDFYILILQRQLFLPLFHRQVPNMHLKILSLIIALRIMMPVMKEVTK
ncbi:MAG: hypothetical protein M3R50_08485 [Bacteroidota bacterium]|nr:hypothetical protein [Bacteroidota bacterium]